MEPGLAGQEPIKHPGGGGNGLTLGPVSLANLNVIVPHPSGRDGRSLGRWAQGVRLGSHLFHGQRNRQLPAPVGVTWKSLQEACLPRQGAHPKI